MLETLILIAVVACIGAFLGGMLGKRRSLAEIRGDDGERRVAKVISSLGFPAFHDVYLPSTNGTTQIDHVVRVGNSIFVIETKNLSGALYGTSTDRNWRQSFRRGDSRSFLNPIVQNGIHVRAVRAVAGPAADIRELVVLAGNARFPQGMPSGVIHVSDLKRHLRLAFVDAGRYGTVEAPWGLLVSAVKSTNRRHARNDHGETVRRAARRRSGADADGRIEPRMD